MSKAKFSEKAKSSCKDTNKRQKRLHVQVTIMTPRTCLDLVYEREGRK